MFVIQFDRFQDQIDLVGGVDFARDTVIGVVLDLERFFKIVKPIDSLRVVVFHPEDNTRAVFCPRDE